MESKDDDVAKKEHDVDKISQLVQNLSLTKQKAYERDHFKVPGWLQEYECPFLWHSQEVRGLGPEIVIARHLEKLDDLKIDDPGFSIQRFLTMLKLVVEYYVTDQMLECWANMDEVEALLAEAGLEAEASKEDDPYFKVKRVLDHVVLANKANLLELLEQADEAKQILADITKADNFNNPERASLYAMKARYFLYSGYENGENIGVGFAKQALELEPDKPEWAYIMAKILRQKRKAFPHSAEIPREELLLLEKAVKNSDEVNYKVYLAQIYRECASAAIKVYRDSPDFFKSDMFKTLEKFQTTAMSLYKKAAETHPDSPSVLRRVGYGIINLPGKMLGPGDLKLALDSLLRSAELSENQMTLHVLGTYYFRHGNDPNKALEYFEKSVTSFRSHAGLCDKVRIKFQMDQDYDPVPDLRNGLEWELKKANRIQLVSQLGTYYLFIKRDLIKCIETFDQAIDDEDNIPHLKAFKSVFLRMYKPINLFHYLTNECLLRLRTDSSESADVEKSNESDLKIVTEFHQKIVKIDPESANVEVNAKMVNNLLSMSRSIQNRERSQRNAQSRGYRRGRGRGYFPRRGDSDHSRGRFYDSRSQGGERREWRDWGGDGHQNRGHRYQGNRGYRGRGGAQGSGEQNESCETDEPRRGGGRWNNRYQGNRGGYRGRGGQSPREQGDFEESKGEGDNRNYQYLRQQQTSGQNSETNWREK